MTNEQNDLLTKVTEASKNEENARQELLKAIKDPTDDGTRTEAAQRTWAHKQAETRTAMGNAVRADIEWWKVEGALQDGYLLAHQEA